jgi:hypothetical protein
MQIRLKGPPDDVNVIINDYFDNLLRDRRDLIMIGQFDREDFAPARFRHRPGP